MAKLLRLWSGEQDGFSKQMRLLQVVYELCRRPGQKLPLLYKRPAFKLWWAQKLAVNAMG